MLQKFHDSFKEKQVAEFLVFAKIIVKKDSLAHVRLKPFIAQLKTFSFPFVLSSNPRIRKMLCVHILHDTVSSPIV